MLVNILWAIFDVMVACMIVALLADNIKIFFVKRRIRKRMKERY